MYKTCSMHVGRRRIMQDFGGKDRKKETADMLQYTMEWRLLSHLTCKNFTLPQPVLRAHVLYSACCLLSSSDVTDKLNGYMFTEHGTNSNLHFTETITRKWSVSCLSSLYLSINIIFRTNF
jgi:hypothetical protein